jgi:hypothetical protein
MEEHARGFTGVDDSTKGVLIHSSETGVDSSRVYMVMYGKQIWNFA